MEYELLPEEDLICPLCGGSRWGKIVMDYALLGVEFDPAEQPSEVDLIACKGCGLLRVSHYRFEEKIRD